MQSEDYVEDHDDISSYRVPDEIYRSELSDALGTLSLLSDDPYLRIQAFSFSVVDQFIMQLEYDMLHKLRSEESIRFQKQHFSQRNPRCGYLQLMSFSGHGDRERVT